MKISPATNNAVPIVLIYGDAGRGKTTLACKFPKPLALLLERGLPRGVTVDAVEEVNTFDGVVGALRALIEDRQNYQTLIVDAVDSLEPLVWAHTCTRHGWKSIEQPSYGKGYVEADNTWRQFLRGVSLLRDRGMTIVLTGHSTINRVQDPRAPEFTSYAPRLHKRACHLVLDACDAVLFLAEDLRIMTDEGGFKDRVRATSSNRRFLFTEGCPAFAAKNRYSMPPKIAIPADLNIGELTKYWRA